MMIFSDDQNGIRDILTKTLVQLCFNRKIQEGNTLIGKEINGNFKNILFFFLKKGIRIKSFFQLICCYDAHHFLSILFYLVY